MQLCCSRVAYDILFPDGIVDRSVLRGITGHSPCWTDCVAFLTGARTQRWEPRLFQGQAIRPRHYPLQGGHQTGRTGHLEEGYQQHPRGTGYTPRRDHLETGSGHGRG